MPKVKTARIDNEHDDDFEVPATRTVETRTVLRETRDADARPEIGADGGPDLTDYEWRRPTALDAPPPRPGYAQRWVRASMRNDKDTVNWGQKYREGWRPRMPDTLPPAYRHLAGSLEAASSGQIVVGGLVLCEIPEQIMRSKRAAIRAAVERQELSVSTETENVSREGARFGAPPVVRAEKTTVERGRRPSTALAE